MSHVPEQVEQDTRSRAVLWFVIAIVAAVAVAGFLLTRGTDGGATGASGSAANGASGDAGGASADAGGDVDGDTEGSAEETKASVGRAATDGLQVEAAYEERADMLIGDMCDLAEMNWQCFYNGFDTVDGNRVDLNLVFTADVSRGQREEIADTAREDVFESVGGYFGKLDTVASYNNRRDDTFVESRDSQITERDDVAALN